MNTTKQKHLIENLLSSNDIYSRCSGIIKSDYFDPKLKPVVKYIIDYYQKYNYTPSFKNVNAEFNDIDLSPTMVMDHEIKSSCDEIEKFCQECGLTDAILLSVDDIKTGNFGKVYDRVKSALEISLSKDLGIEMYSEDALKILQGLLETQIRIPCGIDSLDDPIGGGFTRQEFTLFSANSGGGKSVMLANIGANYSSVNSKLNVLIISLELAQEMIYLRLGSIISGIKTDVWKEHIPQMAHTLVDAKHHGAGSLRIKRMPNGCTANDIRSFIKQYQLTLNQTPDVLIIDYLDLMSPNGGTKGLNISEQDKAKSEEVAELLREFNMIGLSASQQNREAIKSSSPDQSVIAGGLTKVNTVDYYISLYMTPAMRVTGEMMAFFLKTRSSSAVGTSVPLAFNTGSLQITDIDKKTKTTVIPSKRTQLNLPGVEDINTVDINDEMREILGDIDIDLYSPPILTPEFMQAAVNKQDDNHEIDLIGILYED